MQQYSIYDISFPEWCQEGEEEDGEGEGDGEEEKEAG